MEQPHIIPPTVNYVRDVNMSLCLGVEDAEIKWTRRENRLCVMVVVSVMLERQDNATSVEWRNNDY